jgi:DNA-binding beta-propeller fold protein YncE
LETNSLQPSNGVEELPSWPACRLTLDVPRNRRDVNGHEMTDQRSIARIWSGCVGAVYLGLALAGCGGDMTATSSNAPAVMQSAGLAFVTNINSNNVSAFQVDATSGKLAPVGSPSPTDNGPEFLAVSPGGKFLFVGNSGSDTVSAFQIDAGSGALTAVAGSPFVTGTRPEGVAVDPRGRFVFVGNQGSSSISVFGIGTDGSLAPVPGSPFAAGSPFQLALSPSGTILFATNFPDSMVSDLNTVSAFQVGSNGALTAVPGSPFPVASSAGFASAIGLAADSAGKFLFVGDHMAQAIVPFQISPTNGALTPVAMLPTPPASCGVSCHNNPLRLAVHPNNQFVYATNVQAGTVSAFVIVTGGLSPISDFPTGQHPFGVALDPAGSFLYVVNKLDNSVSAFSVNAGTGMLSPVAGAPFSSGGTGPVGILVIPKP